jgi:hypothetical protein
MAPIAEQVGGGAAGDEIADLREDATAITAKSSSTRTVSTS